MPRRARWISSSTGASARSRSSADQSRRKAQQPTRYLPARLTEGSLERRRRLAAVHALAVPEQEVLRLEASECAPRRCQPQQRVNAGPFLARTEVADAAECVSADQGPLVSKPDGDFSPDASSADGQH